MKNLKLKAARAALDLSQQDLADKVGVSRQAVAKWEAGETVPDRNTACNGSQRRIWDALYSIDLFRQHSEYERLADGKELFAENVSCIGERGNDLFIRG